MEAGRSQDAGLNFWGMVTFSLKLMLRRWSILYFFIPALVFSVLSLLISGYLLPGYSSNPEYFLDEANLTELMRIIPLIVTTALIGWALGSYASMCVYAASSMEFRGKDWNAPDIMAGYLGRFPGFLAVSVLAGLIILCPLIIVAVLGLLIHPLLWLFIIPGTPLMVYLSIRLCVSEVSYIVEGKGVVEAMGRSFYLTGNRFWYVFLRLLAFGIVAVIILIPSMIISSYLANQPQGHPLSILLSVINDIIGYYYQTAVACFSFLIFNSLVFMKTERGVGGSFEPAVGVIH